MDKHNLEAVEAEAYDTAPDFRGNHQAHSPLSEAHATPSPEFNPFRAHDGPIGGASTNRLWNCWIQEEKTSR